MTHRSKTSCASAALLGVAVLLTLGSAADASAVAVMATTRPCVRAQDGERQAMAEWLSRLTEAARRLQGEAAAVVPPTLRVPEPALARFAAQAYLDDARRPHAAPLDCRLIDLPPPVI